MKIKYLSLFSLFVTSIILSLTNPVHGESNTSSEKTFFCQADGNMPITLAKASNGETIPIFNWKQELFPSGTNLQAICDNVSVKLEKYLASDNDLSFVSFEVKKVMDNSTPAICLTDAKLNAAKKSCNLVLLTFEPGEESTRNANYVLEQILNPQLPIKKDISNHRGIQSNAYTVSFWELLGLNLR